MSSLPFRTLAGLALLVAVAFPGLAQSTPSVLEKSVAGKDQAVPFTVAGDWWVSNAEWKSPNTVTIRPDGTFSVFKGSSGKWILTADGGTPLLVLRWEKWGTESVAMISPNHFRGQIRPGGYIDMFRIIDNPASKPAESGAADNKVLGAWDVKNLGDYSKAIYDINADHTFERNGSRAGTWEVKETHLTLRYDNSGSERYEISTSTTQLDGVNNVDQALSMTRK